MNLELALNHLRQNAQFRIISESVVLPDFTPSGNVYFDLLESIVSQQLSVKVATVIFNRFRALFPDNYPHPDELSSIPIEQLRSVGLSNQKAVYLQNVAAFSRQYDLENHDWAAMTDDEVIAFLCQIKGVGKWTSEMILMFTMGRPDVFPIDDLGIQQAMIRLFDLHKEDKKLKNKMVELSEPWRPYRTVVCRYLWRWKDNLTPNNSI